MTHASAARQGFESGRSHLVGIADTPVDNRAHTTEGAMKVAGDLTPKRPVKMWFVQVLHDHDFWARNRREIVAILAPGGWVLLGVLRVARLAGHGHGIAGHRPHLRHVVAHRLEVETVPIGFASRNLFPAIVDGGGIPTLELVDFAFGQTGLLRFGHGFGVEVTDEGNEDPKFILTSN